MTPSEKQELEEQIESIKASIETEVQLLDGFNDELRQRFIPTQLYIQMEDYRNIKRIIMMLLFLFLKDL